MIVIVDNKPPHCIYSDSPRRKQPWEQTDVFIEAGERAKVSSTHTVANRTEFVAEKPTRGDSAILHFRLARVWPIEISILEESLDTIGVGEQGWTVQDEKLTAVTLRSLSLTQECRHNHTWS